MSTVDPKKIEMYKYFSTVWWDEIGPIKVLHAMNQLRVPFVRDGLVNLEIISKELADTPTPLKNLLILEAGCGGGIFSEALAKLGANVVGIDPSPEQIQLAKEHASLDSSLTNLSYFLETVEDHAVNNHEKYDVVISAEVLEHVLDHEKYLEVCVKCLKPGGSIFITTESKNLISWFKAIILDQYVFNFISRGAITYDRFISPGDTERILKRCECQTKTIRGWSYNFLTNTMNWTWHSLVYYCLHAVKK